MRPRTADLTLDRRNGTATQRSCASFNEAAPAEQRLDELVEALQSVDEIGKYEHDAIDIAVHNQFFEHVGNALRPGDKRQPAIKDPRPIMREPVTEDRDPVLGFAAGPLAIDALDRLFVGAGLIMLQDALRIRIGVAEDEADERVGANVSPALAGNLLDAFAPDLLGFKRGPAEKSV